MTKIKTKIFTLVFLSFALGACATAPQFNSGLIRPWNSALEKDVPSDKPWIAHHEQGDYELYYLAAHHSTDLKSDSLRLVDKLFRDFDLGAVIIEAFPNSFGKSPQWFVDESYAGLKSNSIKGGESSWAAVRAYEKGRPFFGGEIDHRQLYLETKKKGYQDNDILGFYFVRQIPEWIREKEDKNTLLKKMGPGFINYYCINFGILLAQCPKLDDIKNWYAAKTNKTLTADVDPEEVAPLKDSPDFLHQLSSDIDDIRNQFTLQLIGKLLKEYKHVAVVYGSSHYLMLQKSIEASMGPSLELTYPEDDVF